jgi:serine/threonine protein kinase
MAESGELAGSKLLCGAPKAGSISLPWNFLSRRVWAQQGQRASTSSSTSNSSSFYHAAMSSEQQQQLAVAAAADYRNSVQCPIPTFTSPLFSAHAQLSSDCFGEVVNDYLLFDELFRSCKSSVWLAIDQQTGESRCIKIVDRPKLLKATIQEVAIWKGLNHVGVLPLYEVIDDPALNRLYYVMKYCDGGSIVKDEEIKYVPGLAAEGGGDVPAAIVGFKFTAVPADKLAGIARSVTAALMYLHEVELIIHNDIKPANILSCARGSSCDSQVYLADFEIASSFKGSEEEKLWSTLNVDERTARLQSFFRSRRMSCTVVFLAPECFQDEAATKAFSTAYPKQSPFLCGKATDVWALGVTFYCALTGRLPFDRQPAEAEGEGSFDSIGADHRLRKNGTLRPSDRPSEKRTNEIRATSFSGFQASLLETIFDPDPMNSVQFDDSVPSLWRELLRGMLTKNPLERWTLPMVRNYVKGVLCGVSPSKCADLSPLRQFDNEDADVEVMALPPNSTAAAGGEDASSNVLSTVRNRLSCTITFTSDERENSVSPLHAVANDGIDREDSSDEVEDGFGVGSPVVLHWVETV